MRRHGTALAALLVTALGCASPITESPPPKPASWDPTGQARANYCAALDLFRAWNFNQAYLEFSRLDVEPHFYEAWFKMGLCRYFQQKFDLEIECYERCLEIRPDYLPCLVSVGAAYLQNGDEEDAVRTYRKILEIEPRHPVARYNLGLIKGQPR